MGRVEIFGQPLTSAFSMADHCFISSEIGGICGRSRMVRGVCLVAPFPFAFFAFNMQPVPSNRHGFGAAGWQEKFRLGEGLYLLKRGVRGDLAEQETLRRDV